MIFARDIRDINIRVCVCDRALSKSSGCLFETSICWYCLVQLLCGVRCLVSPQNEQQSHDHVKKTFICVCNSGGSKRTFHSNEYACATISIQKIFYMNQSNNLISILYKVAEEIRDERYRKSETQSRNRHTNMQKAYIVRTHIVRDPLKVKHSVILLITSCNMHTNASVLMMSL